MRVCPSCGEENPDRFRLCGFCGTELVAAAPAPDVRKTVTVLFCDLKGSTSLAERIDTESLRGVLTRYFGEMRRVIEAHGGTVEKFIGDAVMAVFGLPRIREDDALRAVRAAFEMREALAELNVELEARWGVRLVNRTGVNTGEVVAGDVSSGQRLVTGDTVNVAARLEQAAPELQTLLGEPTYRLVRDAVDVEPMEPLELKGKAEPVAAYRLLAVHAREGFARHHEAPLVGRAEELARLHEALDQVARDPGCRMVTVLGPAGAGKSRLVAEFLRDAAGRGRVVRGRCVPYGEGITFLPLGDVVRDAAGVRDDDPIEVATRKVEALLGPSGEHDDDHERREILQRVASAMGLSSTSYAVEETFWGARKLLEALAREAPLVALFDDIHWAEPTFLDLIEHVRDVSHGVPILLLGTARHELIDERPEWERRRGNATTISLRPLSDEESSLVAANALGSARLPHGVGARIVAAAQGNPLYIEQILSMLIEEGTLSRGEDGRWVMPEASAPLTIPPSITALIAARLDLLPAEEREVAERGAVIGETFYRGAVEALTPPDLRDRVRPGLMSLARRKLIGPGSSLLAGEDAFRFQHGLIQDTAYRGLLKRRRAELHESFAAWLEDRAGSRLLEVEEVLGHHLEQAWRYRGELGPGDEGRRALGERASAPLGSAGSRALARGDARAATNLLERAVEVAPPDGAARRSMLPTLAEALMELGEFGRAEAMVEEAIANATAAGDDDLAGRARVVRLAIRFSTEPETWAAFAIDELTPIIATFEAAEDHLGLAKAWALEGYVHGAASRFGAAEQAVGRALEHARIAGDRRQEARCLSAYAQAAVYGPLPVPLALARCEELLKEAEGDRRAEALVLLALARLRALGAEPDVARDLYRRSRAIYEDLGGGLAAALVAIDSGPVEMLAGDLEAAEAELRHDYEALARIGERAYLATTAAWLAQVMVQTGRLVEAETFSRISEDAALPDDVETQVIWRAALGKARALAGERDEAVALLGEALALVERTEQPDAQGMVLLDFARVHEASGSPGEATSLALRARALFEAKGNLVSATSADELLARVGR